MGTSPSSPDVRASLVAALQADLVGPFSAGAENEILTIAPSRWYLTGFLAPQDDRETKDPTADEDFGAAGDDEDENDDAPEPEPKQKSAFPASMGLSVFLPAALGERETLEVAVRFAEYVCEDRETGEGKKKRKCGSACRSPFAR